MCLKCRVVCVVTFNTSYCCLLLSITSYVYFSSSYLFWCYSLSGFISSLSFKVTSLYSMNLFFLNLILNVEKASDSPIQIGCQVIAVASSAACSSRDQQTLTVHVLLRQSLHCLFKMCGGSLLAFAREPVDGCDDPDDVWYTYLL